MRRFYGIYLALSRSERRAHPTAEPDVKVLRQKFARTRRKLETQQQG